MSQDDKVMKLIELVNLKKEKIKRLNNPTYKTNGLFSYSNNPNVDKININVLKDAKALAVPLAFLMSINSHYKGISGEDLVWCGYTFDSWKEDLTTRMEKMNLDKLEKELKILEDRLDKLISPELKRELELKEIEKELGL